MKEKNLPHKSFPTHRETLKTYPRMNCVFKFENPVVFAERANLSYPTPPRLLELHVLVFRILHRMEIIADKNTYFSRRFHFRFFFVIL